MPVEWVSGARRRRWPLVLGIMAVPVVLLAALILPQVWIRSVNDAAAHDVETRLENVPLPAGAERIDSLSVAAKLSGNGNGMQYLGALLIRSDQDLDDIQAYYDAHPGVGDLAVSVTTSAGLGGLHRTPGFLGDAGDPDTFIVFAWGDGPGGLFEDSDLRGH